MTGFRLHGLDEGRVAVFASDLRDALARDDRSALAALLSPADPLASWSRRLVDLFLVAPSHAPAAEVRLAVRTRALAVVSTSVVELESRVTDDLVRGFATDCGEPLASRLLALLDETRAPFFLRAPDTTLGWLTSAERAAVARDLAGRDVGALDELRDALDELDTAVLLERR